MPRGRAMLLTTALAFAPVLSARARLGGGILFGLFVAPKLGNLAPSCSRDFFVSFVPGIARFFPAAARATIVFVLLLVYDVSRASCGGARPYRGASPRRTGPKPTSLLPVASNL